MDLEVEKKYDEYYKLLVVVELGDMEEKDEW